MTDMVSSDQIWNAHIGFSLATNYFEIRWKWLESLKALSYLKWGAFSRWSSSLYCPMQNSDKMTIGKMQPTLYFCINRRFCQKWCFWLKTSINRLLPSDSIDFFLEKYKIHVYQFQIWPPLQTGLKVIGHKDAPVISNFCQNLFFYLSILLSLWGLSHFTNFRLRISWSFLNKALIPFSIKDDIVILIFT